MISPDATLTSGTVRAVQKCVCENRVDPCEAEIEVEPRALQLGVDLGGEKVGGVRVGGIRSVRIRNTCRLQGEPEDANGREPFRSGHRGA